jgi:catechol 2,3-dioxygenase-like lactoylglutathione lyase family enzyme
MAFNHMGIGVSDLAASRAFYEGALAPLGFEVVREFDEGVAFGDEGRPTFWLFSNRPAAGPIHLAFTASDRAAVQGFHAGALAGGGRDNGGPGLRTNYAPTYYAAFAYDPDGHNIEAVTFSEV